MRVTHVSICPTDAANRAGRPALTPELLAASGARYSRNNEGLHSILERIDPDDLDKSVDSIFRLIDYGHQSIADMAPVAMFIDNISLWLAYYVWTLCPTAGGQESSTRYIELSPESVVDPDVLGIPSELQGEWRDQMATAFSNYATALTSWESLGNASPELTSIPESLLSDSSAASRKAVQRMKRNFKYDRARYYLPVAAATNMMLVMSARAWAHLCATLCSHPASEPQHLGDALRDELALVAPRLIKHAQRKQDVVDGLRAEFKQLQQEAINGLPDALSPGVANTEHRTDASVWISTTDTDTRTKLDGDLAFHSNRYAWMGSNLRRTSVRFSWDAMALAEIRDLNRHRTGNKYCPMRPLGFYSALDQLPRNAAIQTESVDTIRGLNEFGRTMSATAHAHLAEGIPSYMYWTLLGSQYPFEQLTTADKFIYEAELRTGLGAHFKYAQHMRDALTLWYQSYPETRGLIIEGEAEPE